MNYKLIQMNVHGDVRGKLISLEALKSVPFYLNQISFIHNAAIDESDKEQMIIAISGSCHFTLEQGTKQIEVRLDHPDSALYTGRDVCCRLVTSSEDCKLLILSPDKDHAQYEG
jgi:hypothetical protein